MPARILLLIPPALLAALILLSFVLPLEHWSTGERGAPPLPLDAGGLPVEMPRRVWIDTDAACGHAFDADADDCFALLILLRAAEIDVVGISVVDGNAPAAAVERIARDLATQVAPVPPPVHRGPAAQGALRAALADGPLVVIALGPLTNIAAALREHPHLAPNVAHLVAVMGRRPGHLFHPSEGSGTGILFGHGPVFRDFNFDKDRTAARDIIAMHLPLTLIPYEGARTVRLTAADLARLEETGGGAAWVARRASGWLRFWADIVGLDGFYPFDALAAAYAIEPALADCTYTEVWVARDMSRWGGHRGGGFGSEALLIGPVEVPAEKRSASGPAIYCPGMSPVMHDWLMTRLIGRQGTFKRGGGQPAAPRRADAGGIAGGGHEQGRDSGADGRRVGEGVGAPPQTLQVDGRRSPNSALQKS